MPGADTGGERDLPDFGEDEESPSNDREEQTKLQDIFQDIWKGEEVELGNLKSRLQECGALADEDNGGAIDKKTILDRLLNFVVDRRVGINEYSKFTDLINIALENNPSLIQEESHDKRNILHLSIRARKMQLFHLFVDIADSRKISLAEAIGAEHQNGTCLHEAIIAQLPIAFIQYLLKRCDPNILTAGDADGNTALHLAVQHANFSKRKQDPDFAKKRVELLVASRHEFLDKRNNQGLTPLQVLRKDKVSSMATLGARAKKRKTITKAKPSQTSPRSAIEAVEAGAGNLLLSTERTQLEAADRGMGQELKARDVLEAKERVLSAVAYPPARETAKAEQPTTPLRERSMLDMSSISQKPPNSSEGQNIGEMEAKIAFEDMDHYLTWMVLRHYPNDDARNIIYGSMAEQREIDFNLLGVNRLLDVKIIKESYNFLKFSKTLQYVALPALQRSTPQSPGKENWKDEGENQVIERSSPSPYLEVFKWLRTRGVERVMEIIIEDDLDDPTTDAEIQSTLKDLCTEIWNWRKYDISADTIVQAAPHARELYLYTTGKKAVLREWSDEEGLHKLKNLDKLVLKVAGVVSRQKIPVIRPEVEANLKQFKSRLNALVERDWKITRLPKDYLTRLLEREYHDAKEIDLEELIKRLRYIGTVHGHVPQQQDTRPATEEHEPISIEWDAISSSSKGIQDYQTPSFGPDDRQNAHRWISTVKLCTKWLEEQTETDKTRRIKVALIDDGVDASYDDLYQIIATGTTYCPEYRCGRKITSSYYASTSGHGTAMALLIRLVCPWVELYVARLDDYRNGDRSSFTAKSAAKAIDWAINCGVDILSMSWTIDLPEQHIPSELKEALHKAEEKNILMLCAARDEGIENPSQNRYPAAGSTQSIIIGAATPTGIHSPRVNQAAVHFLFPGTELQDAGPEFKHPDLRSLDGSSSATALASGLVALLLFIFAQSPGTKSIPKNCRCVKVRNILKSVVNERYVAIWDLFDEYIKPPPDKYTRLLLDTEQKAEDKTLEDLICRLHN